MDINLNDYIFNSLEESQSKCVCIKSDYDNKNFVDVIMTFNSYEQFHFEIKVPHKITEDDFIKFILGVLTIDKLMDIKKISLCVYYGVGVHCFDYAITPGRSGKYYFNIDVNGDMDTHYWNNFRNKMVKDFKGQNQSSLDAVIKYKENIVYPPETKCSKCNKCADCHYKSEPEQTSMVSLKDLINMQEFIAILEKEKKEKFKKHCIDNAIDCFDVTFTFKKGNTQQMYIRIPHNLNEEEFIIFLLGTLTKTKLKTLFQIDLVLENGKHLKCFNYVFNDSRNGTYYFDINLINDDDTNKWHSLRKMLLNTYNGLNTNAMNAIIKLN